jgi:transcriptional regulator with XRE-family HTH domain
MAGASPRDPANGASPTVRQRELGVRLRQLRTGLGLTIEDVADKLLCSAAKIGRAETGARRPTLRDVRDLCLLYGVDEQTTTELMDLTREARKEGWWARYDDLKLSPYIGLEQEASSITCFSMYVVPALLQTKEYAESIVKDVAPKIDPKIHQQRVDARLHRQQLLDKDNSPHYHAFLDEAVLYRRVGGSVIMARQLAKIIEVERAGKATVQVIPFDVGAYAAADSNFVLLEFDQHIPRPVVFVEGLTSNAYQEHKGDLDRYREAIDYLGKSARSPEDSILRIAELQKEYGAAV